MTNKLIIAFVVAVALGGGAWYLMQTGVIRNIIGASERVSQERFTEETSLAALAARGGSWKCIFATESDIADSSGTVYVAGERMRGDFTSNVAQANIDIESHMVRDGQWIYSWSNQISQGFKVPVALAESGAAGAVSGSASFDVNANLTWRCDAWPTDEARFEIPGNVSFRTVQ